ncbi:MAG: M23 family metallopeptidase, partial [Acidimicrobiia bacterium]|nr:M23 family metallopeptidase [Acidimicrobiia bacterium]
MAVGSGKPTVDATSTPDAPPSSPIVHVPSAAPAAPAAASASLPFSDPLWYPLRRSDMDFWRLKPLSGAFSGMVACVVDNCPDGHGYWAIDFIGDRGDAVYAAGSGILHVAPGNRGCPKVWIDHGGGVLTKYRHMDSIAAPDGALVTPATKIGEIGDKSLACNGSGTVNYLHFEV